MKKIVVLSLLSLILCSCATLQSQPNKQLSNAQKKKQTVKIALPHHLTKKKNLTLKQLATRGANVSESDDGIKIKLSPSYFSQGELDQNLQTQLDLIAQYLNQNMYADATIGNKNLSKRQATQVVHYLEAIGIPASRLSLAKHLKTQDAMSTRVFINILAG